MKFTGLRKKINKYYIQPLIWSIGHSISVWLHKNELEVPQCITSVFEVWVLREGKFPKCVRTPTSCDHVEFLTQKF
jgi:hypothetical protein